MNYRVLAFGALGLLAANIAHANVVFDNVTGITPDIWTGPQDGGDTTLMGASFHSTTPYISSISLLLSSSTPGDGGTSTVYLVPDSGSTLGVASFPTLENSSGTFTNLRGAQTVATIADSRLTGHPSLATFAINPRVTSSNQEYWVVLQTTSASSVEWYTADDASGLGTSGQAFFNDYGGNGYSSADLTPSPDSYGGYQMVVRTPEPATIAILGGGLAGLGYFHRRPARKA